MLGLELVTFHRCDEVSGLQAADTDTGNTMPLHLSSVMALIAQYNPVRVQAIFTTSGMQSSSYQFLNFNPLVKDCL